MQSNAMKTLDAFLDSYYKWLKEMSEQNHKFYPFNLDSSKFHALDFVRYSSSNRGGRYANWSWMDNQLNKHASDISKTLSKDEAFIELFYRATKSFVETII